MFEIEVVSDPSALYSADGMLPNENYPFLTQYDESLIKPALLLADKVHLRTLREDFSQIVNSEAFKFGRMPMRMVGLYEAVSLARDPRALELFEIEESDLALKEDLLFLAKDRNIEKVEAFGEKYSTQIEKVAEGKLKTLRKRHNDLVSPALNKAQELGILSVSPWHTEKNVTQEQIWKMVWDRDNKNFFDEGRRAIEKHLSETDATVLIEAGARSLLSPKAAGLKTKRRDRGFDQSMRVSSVLTEHIPRLAEMPLDEILELRESLREHLIPFRASFLSMADEVQSMENMSTESIARFSEMKWQKEIAPEYEELKQQIQRSSYPRNFLKTVSSDKDSYLAIGSAITLAVGGKYTGIGGLIGTGTAASFPFVKAFYEKLKARDKAKGHRLYFLYELDKRTQRR